MRQLVLLLLLGAAVPSRCVAADDSQFKLENGLKVLLRPAPASSHVALVVLFDIGDDHDPDGQSGLAHLVEHVYVTAATRTAKARTVRDYTAAYPHGWNAQTGDRYTVIATVFDPRGLKRELDDAAERMRSLRVTDADLDREKPRIRDELYNMFGGIPQIAVNNLAREGIHPGPRGHRKGGLIEQVVKLGPGDVQEWWRRYYKASHATLVLAGRFDPREARRRIEKHFASIEPGEPLPKIVAEGKPNFGAPRQVRIKPLQQNARPRVCLAFAAPSQADPLFAAFLVLAARLQTRTSELRTGPYSFPVQFLGIDDPSALYVTSEVPAGETAAETVRRLDEFVQSVIRPPIKPTDRNTANSVFRFVYGFPDAPLSALNNNVYGTAFSLGRCLQLGIEPARLAKDIAEVQQQAIDQCRKTVFDPQRRAAVIVTVD